jgi:HEAT repeat protein
MVRLLLFATAILASSSSYAAIPKHDPSISRALKQDLGKRSTRSFEAMLKTWESRYGAQAVDPLLRIASDRKNSDPDRYIALMGVAKLGGKTQAPKISGFLKDPSWMLRSACLRVLGAFQEPTTASRILPLLKDPALVVRLEAVQTLEKLKPVGSEEALVAVLRDERNYHAGKAQWVPQRALTALVTLNAKSSAPKLLPLLGRTSDPELQRQTVAALESLMGRKLKNGKPLPEQVASWRAELSRN